MSWDDPAHTSLPPTADPPPYPFGALWLDSQSVGSTAYEPQLCKLPSPTPPVHHDVVRSSSKESYADSSIESIASAASIDSGYHSIFTNEAILPGREYFPKFRPRRVSRRHRYEDEPQRVDSCHGLNRSTSGQPGQPALPQSRKLTVFNDYNNHDTAHPTPTPKQADVGCDLSWSLRLPSLRMHQSITTAEENTTYQGRQEASSAIAVTTLAQACEIESNFRGKETSDSIDGSAAKSDRFPVEGPTSNESFVAKRLDLGSSLAQEDQTKQPVYVKKWVDSTCAIQSPPSGYSGGEMTSSSLDFGIGYATAMSESGEDRIDTDSESFVLTEDSENSPDWDPNGAMLVPMKLEYMDRLLFSFNLLQRQLQSSVASDMAGSDHSTGSSSGKHRPSSPPPGNGSELRPHKKKRRQSGNGDSGEGHGGDDDGSNPQSTPPNIAEDSQGTRLFFACPFVKRYPHRYHKCYSHTLKDVARVKYHLFRDKDHRLPIYCPTCSETFSSEDLRDEHVRALTCTMKPPVKWEGITANQREQLNKRSPSTNSAVENWNSVYKILFPGDPVPASPYIDMSLSGDLRAFREHALSTGPLIWDEILRTRLPENLRSSQGELQSFYRSYYPEAITSLFETWNSIRSSTRSLQSQSSTNLIQRETEYLAPPINTAAVDGSSSPSGSDSALGKSVTNGSQSENEPSPASQDEVALAAQTQQQQQQQQSIMQRDPQASFVPQQLQPTLSFPQSTPQTPSFTHVQNTNIPFGAQCSFGSAEFAGYGFLQNSYEYAQVPTFTPSARQMFNTQYALGTTQPDPEINQFQCQPPSGGFPQDAFHQPHQMQNQLQDPCNIPTPHPHALNPEVPAWAPSE